MSKRTDLDPKSGPRPRQLSEDKWSRELRTQRQVFTELWQLNLLQTPDGSRLLPELVSELPKGQRPDPSRLMLVALGIAQHFKPAQGYAAVNALEEVMPFGRRAFDAIVQALHDLDIWLLISESNRPADCDPDVMMWVPGPLLARKSHGNWRFGCSIGNPYMWPGHERDRLLA